MRQVAGVLGPLLLAARPMAVLFIVLKGMTWALTQNPDEPRDVGIARAVFITLWVGGLVLARFATERDSPDPVRWFVRRRRSA